MVSKPGPDAKPGAQAAGQGAQGKAARSQGRGGAFVRQQGMFCAKRLHVRNPQSPRAQTPFSGGGLLPRDSLYVPRHPVLDREQERALLLFLTLFARSFSWPS